jgi:hypothetical protein
MSDADIPIPAPLTPPTCGTCAHFRAYTDARRKASGNLVLGGDGECLANPPGAAIAMGQHQLTSQPLAMLMPQRPPVNRDEHCRLWSDTFAGDADSDMADALVTIANYIRETIGRKA